MSKSDAMRVLLINPPYPFEESPTPPFGLASLAGYLREQNIDVKIEDYIVTPYSIERIKKILSEYHPGLVGATAVTMNVKSALKIISDYKNADPDIITVMGGPHVTFDADAVLSDHKYLDYIVRGEGEITFCEMLKLLEEESSVENVQGISYRNKGEVVHNALRPFIDDINILPYPARDLLPLSKYKALSCVINMSTSRGCPYKCIFCVGSRMVGPRVRYFAVKRVVDEFEMLAKLGFNRINVVDDLFTANKRRCNEICEGIIRRGIKQDWAVFARVDTISKPLLEKMKEAGCVSLCFGIESGCQEILNTIKKKITLEKCQEAVSMCREVGIDPMASYIFGLPGETPDTARQSLEFAEKLCANHGFHILSPFPGTEVRDRHKEYGVRILTSDWDRYDANQAVSETEYISHDEIDRISKNFNKKYQDEFVDSIERYERGEKVSEKSELMIKTLKNFMFVRDLIVNEYIDRFNGSSNGQSRDEVISSFAANIASHSKYRENEAQGHLNRLLDMKCLNFQQGEEGISLVWKNLVSGKDST